MEEQKLDRNELGAELLKKGIPFNSTASNEDLEILLKHGVKKIKQAKQSPEGLNQEQVQSLIDAALESQKDEIETLKATVATNAELSKEAFTKVKEELAKAHEKIELVSADLAKSDARISELESPVVEEAENPKAKKTTT